MKKNIEKTNEERFHAVHDRILIIFVILVLGITVILSALFLDRSTQAIRNNASGLIVANSSQLKLNVDSYLDKVESTVALLFADEAYYKYDETSSDYDSYTKIQYEDNIEDQIVDLGIMENFSDFGIIYSDNYSVGWISNTTKSVFGSDQLYDRVASEIKNEKTSDGWFAGVDGTYDRLYYVKRINDNAVVLASFYSRELAHVFTFPDALSGMVIRLVSEDEEILYSSEKEEIGSLMPSDISSAIQDGTRMSILNSAYIINVDACENGWRMVCVMPTDVVLADVTKLKYFTLTTAVILAASFILVGVLIFSRESRNVDNMVNDLETNASTDGLSGLLNKISYQNDVARELEHTIHGSSVGVVLMDVDHFKSINDEMGHAYGDEVIVRTARVIKSVLPKDAIIGRIGGDEFSFTIKAPEKSVDEISTYLEEIMSELMEEFLKEFKTEHEKFDVSVSLGANVFEYKGQQFSTAYKNADTALYVSKEQGRGRYTFYKEGMGDE